MSKVTFGSISTGTLRTEDLLSAFASELDWYVSRGAATDAGQSDEFRKLTDEARKVDPESEEASDVLSELFDALDSLCPPYVRFCAHPDDGADFGFWPDIDALEDAVRYGEVLKVDDLADVPEDYSGEVMLVSDHGNVTYGTVDDAGKFSEVWSVV